MQAARAQQRFVVDGKGRRSAVILPLREYEQLLEDLHDLAVIAERRKEVPIDLAELKRRLKKRASV
jgi:PHD/YefM family antitoxin component YafN of YafNO toxin-antitoxin module